MASASSAPETSALECLVVIGEHHGLQLSVRQIVQDSALPSADVSIAQLVRLRARLRPQGQGRNLGLERAHQAAAERLPAILRLEEPASFYRWSSTRVNDQDAGDRT